MPNSPDAEEKEACRLRATCVCGGPKEPGCLVCWDCFKHRTDITPLKYYAGTFAQWQKTLPPPP